MVAPAGSGYRFRRNVADVTQQGGRKIVLGIKALLDLDKVKFGVFGAMRFNKCHILHCGGFLDHNRLKAWQISALIDLLFERLRINSETASDSIYFFGNQLGGFDCARRVEDIARDASPADANSLQAESRKRPQPRTAGRESSRLESAVLPEIELPCFHRAPEGPGGNVGHGASTQVTRVPQARELARSRGLFQDFLIPETNTNTVSKQDFRSRKSHLTSPRAAGSIKPVTG